MKIDINKYRVTSENMSLSDYSAQYQGEATRKEAKKELKANRKELNVLQEVFFADNRYGLLIILQAPDAAGKDGAIRHVMGGLNPQGCRVHSFKSPSKEELDHGYLWRHYKALPERGMIEIFNRSHYENVLITKVHPKYILNERLPEVSGLADVNEDFWKRRYDQINNFEKYLSDNGIIVLKFFLNLSKEEQKNRFLSRLDEPEKNWKFSSADIEERGHWDDYQVAYEEMIQNTSTNNAPWHIIPADQKWFARVAIGEIIVEKLKSLDLHFPKSEKPEFLAEARAKLMSE